jgi:hypothetical protein
MIDFSIRRREERLGYFTRTGLRREARRRRSKIVSVPKPGAAVGAHLTRTRTGSAATACSASSRPLTLGPLLTATAHSQLRLQRGEDRELHAETARQ